jgi:hypothetical protein
MNFDPSSIGGSPPPAPAPRPATRAGKTARSDFLSAVGVDTIPSSPPPAVMAEVERAAKRYEELRADQRQLHFELCEGRLRIEVQDLDGTALKRIPASSALAIASGGPI